MLISNYANRAVEHTLELYCAQLLLLRTELPMVWSAPYEWLRLFLTVLCIPYAPFFLSGLAHTAVMFAVVGRLPDLCFEMLLVLEHSMVYHS